MATPESTPADPRYRSGFGRWLTQIGPVAGLLAKGAALLAAALATTAAITLLVPEANDYARAAELKHHRLAALPHKVVLVGGSNLAFGVDSARLKEEVGCDVVNMGMNGYFGVRYMLNEVKPFLRPSDVVVIALEYDSFVKSVDGTATNHLALVKAYPKAFAYLDWNQRLAVIGAVPQVAQIKVIRVIEDALEAVRARLVGQRAKDDIGTIIEVESLRGFTPEGDLVSHLGIPWTGEREWGLDMAHTPLDPQVMPLLQEFHDEMQQRGVKVVYSFTPVERSYYALYKTQIDRIYEIMAKQRGLPVPSRPSAYVFDDTMMFDTVYHLDAEGRAIRTDRLAQDVTTQLGGRLACADRETQNGASPRND